MINTEIVERFIPEGTKYTIEEREKAGFEINSHGASLTIKVGQLVCDNLILLHTAIQTASKEAFTISSTPNAKQLQFGLVKLNDAVIRGMVPADLRGYVKTEIIPRDPTAAKYWQGHEITTSADEIHIKMSEYLPIFEINAVFNLYIKEINLTKEAKTSSSMAQYDNLDLPRSRESRLERFTGIQDKFTIPALLLLTAAIGTGLYFGVLAQPKPPIGPIYR